MYCPQCSQPQISEEMRFCSRCGFPLSGVKELIASGGPLIMPEVTKKSERSPSMRGVRQGTWIILAGVILTLFVGLLTAADDDFAALLVLPAACYIVGFLRILYAVFVQERRERKENAQATVSIPKLAAPYPELTAPRGVPIDSFTRPIKTTAEVVQPPSVTENTTRLLDEDADSNRR